MPISSGAGEGVGTAGRGRSQGEARAGRFNGLPQGSQSEAAGRSRDGPAQGGA